MNDSVFEFKVERDIERFISRVQKDPQLLCQIFERACARVEDICCDQYHARRKEKTQCDFSIDDYEYMIIDGDGEDPEPVVILALWIKGFSFECRNNVAFDIEMTNVVCDLNLLPEYFLIQVGVSDG